MLDFDLVDPQELTGLVRAVQRDLDEADFIGSRVLPNSFQDSIRFRYTVGQVLTQRAAKFRAWDTPAPIGARQGFEIREGELAPISEKIPVTEEGAHRQADLLRGAGSSSALVNAIYDDAANEARAVARRIELARWEAIETAKLVINENGVIQSVDFGRNAALTPAAPGTLWSNTGASDPIKDITDDVDLYKAYNNGNAPGAAFISGKTLGYLLRNATLRTILASTIGTPQIITEQALQNVLTTFNLPPLIVQDAAVDVDGVSTRLLTDDRIVYVPGPGRLAGRTVFGPTMEAIKLAEARRISLEDAPGMVAVVEMTSDPVQTWTKATAVVLPVIHDPDSTLRREVW